MSSAEAEFRGIAKDISEALWLQKLLTELGIPSERSCEIFVIMMQLLVSQKIRYNMIKLNMLR